MALYVPDPRPLTEAEHIRQDEQLAAFEERFNRWLDWDEFDFPGRPPARKETDS